MSFEDRLTSAMREHASQPARPEFVERMSRLPSAPRPRQRRGRPVVAVLAGAAAGTALVATLSSALPLFSDSDASAPEASSALPRGYNGIEVVAPGEPCPGAVHSPIAELSAAAKQPIWLPTSEEPRVSDAWSCGVGSAPVLMFDDVQVSYESGWSDVDLDKKWAGYIAEDGGEVIDIGGYSTLVHEGTESAPNNEVMLVVQGTLIRLLSVRDVPIDQLVDLAKAMDFTRASVTP